MKKLLKFKLHLSTLLWLLGFVAVLGTVYLDYMIINGPSSVGSGTASSINNLELSETDYQSVLDNQKQAASLTQNGNIGRANPFSALTP